MSAEIDLDSDFAGGRRDALGDADRHSGSNILSGADRSGALVRRRDDAGVEDAARRSCRALAESQPIETETAAQTIQQPRPAPSGKRGSGLSKFQPLPGGDLPDAGAEQHASQDLVLRQ